MIKANSKTIAASSHLGVRRNITTGFSFSVIAKDGRHVSASDMNPGIDFDKRSAFGCFFMNWYVR